MFKFSRNTDFDFGMESASIIKDASSLTKRASAKSLLKYEKTPNQEDVHIIALGAYEGTGFNRNGDGFSEPDCITNAHYFKDADRALHRHHKNGKKDPKFGNIKAAAYNEPMKRIELIVGHDKDKCADILTEIEKKGQANYSMASKQKYDVCSWCKHKAFSDAARCEHIPDKIGEINKEGEMCGMHNPDPHWFEISYVKRPADRIGMSLQKVAYANDIKPMLTSDFLNIYTGFTPPVDDVLVSKKASDKRHILNKLAAMEKHYNALGGNPLSAKDSFILNELPKINLSDVISKEAMDLLRSEDPSRVFKVAADKGIIFSPDEFVHYVFGNRVKQASIDGMKTMLPTIFEELLDKNAGEAVNNERYEPSELNATSEVKAVISKLAEDHSLFSEPVKARIIRVTMLGISPKSETKEQTKEAFDKELANQYVAYKLAALNYLNQKNKVDDELLWNTIIQNRG